MFLVLYLARTERLTTKQVSETLNPPRTRGETTRRLKRDNSLNNLIVRLHEFGRTM
jgi:hypothetical protein